MLTSISIRDFLVLAALELEAGAGFTAVTGETGAGKSVLLSALAFVAGARARRDHVRAGASSAVVAATFEVGAEHPARLLLDQNGLRVGADEPIILRRALAASGACRCFVNDQPVGAALLAAVGGRLIDLHGQGESRGLYDPARQRDLLDAFAGAEATAAIVRSAWEHWRSARENLTREEAQTVRAGADGDYPHHALAELDKLDPGVGEAEALASARADLQAQERTAEAVAAAAESIARAGVEAALAAAARHLSRAYPLRSTVEAAPSTDLTRAIAAAADAIECALIEAAEARQAVAAAGTLCGGSPEELEAKEVRLFALKAAARKHGVAVDELPAVRQRLRDEIERVRGRAQALADARRAVAAAEAAYRAACVDLAVLRADGAARLEADVATELAPLGLGRARFRVSLSPRAEGPGGGEQAWFEFAPSSGSFVPLHKAASGGEAARLALAISLSLASAGDACTLVFDEADAGLGGAAAASVGVRLARLGATRQAFAITHSPQVAAAAAAQWRISRVDADGSADPDAAPAPKPPTARVERLRPAARREEIARMLAGAEVTREARAAAGRLLAGA